MASLAVINTFAVGQPALFTQFLAARLQVAWNILAEPNTETNWARRMAWATKIFTNYNQDAQKEYLWCLSHPNIQTAGAGITDANLIAAVASFVDSWD